MCFISAIRVIVGLAIMLVVPIAVPLLVETKSVTDQFVVTVTSMVGGIYCGAWIADFDGLTGRRRDE